MKLFYGNDRLATEKAIKALFGDEFETVNGDEDFDAESLFLGMSLFQEERKILLKNLNQNKLVWQKLPDYMATPHQIIIWNEKIDARDKVIKSLKALGVEMREFKRAEKIDQGAVFKVFDAVWARKAQVALKLCKELEKTNDPFAFVGLLTTQIARKLLIKSSEKRAAAMLKTLAQIDVKMKQSGVEPWALVKIAVAKLASL